MKKKMYLYGLFALLVLLIAYAIFYKSDSTYNKSSMEVKVNNSTIIAEIANTEMERAKGLMFRKSLAKNAGMLFIFPYEAEHAFWMANTKIALDIIWADQNKQIVHINHNTPPCTQTGNLSSYCTTYKPDAKAKYVLEVNAGWAKANNVKTGDNLTF